MPITKGLFLPARVTKRLLDGLDADVLSADHGAFEEGDTFFLADDVSLLGTASIGKAYELAPATVSKLKEHGLKANKVMSRFGKCKTVAGWNLHYSPFVEPVPLAVKRDMGYAETFDIGVDLPIATLDANGVEALRELKKYAGSWAANAGPWLDKSVRMVGPGSYAFVQHIRGLATSFKNALEGVPISYIGKAEGEDFEVLTGALATSLAKTLDVAKGWSLAEVLSTTLNSVRKLQEAFPLLKRAHPALKLPDPVWAVQRLSTGKEAGILSAEPRSSRVGKDQVLVNEQQQKEGTPERYATPAAWAIVRLGQPRNVQRGDLPDLPLDKFTRAEWRERSDEEIYYFPLVMVRVLDPPVELRSAPQGKRFASNVDLDADAVEKFGEVPDPVAIRHMEDDELRRIRETLVNVWLLQYDNTPTKDGREPILNSYMFVIREMKRRGMKVPEASRSLEAEAARFSKDQGTTPTQQDKDAPITLGAFLEHTAQPINLRDGIVTVVGSVCSQGATHDDVDMLLQGPLDDTLRKMIESRLGRMFPSHIGKRLSFLHDPELGGPITDHVPLFDLALVPRKNKAVIELAEFMAKADDQFLDVPFKRGPLPAVFQYHFRGRTLHGDLRFKVGKDYLIGWTLLLQKPGISEPKDLRTARQMASTFNPDGGTYNKDFQAPEGIQATAKGRMPVSWLHVQGEFIEPGEVGATRNLPGVIVEVPDAPEFVELGMQKPWFHEYFLTGGKKMAGRLMCRLIARSRQSETDQPFWRCILSKEFLPSVLGRRAMNTGAMPPDGWSWMPVSLERQAPAEFRYWEKKGDEARKVRNALIEARFFTKENVRLVSGQFARVEESKKFTLYLPEGMGPRDVIKQVPTGGFVLVHQVWKGQAAESGGTTREVWRFALNLGGNLRQWELQADPMAGQRVSATTKSITGKALWKHEGDVEPGKMYEGQVFNDTKATPSVMTKLDSGAVTLLKDGDGVVKMRIRGVEMRGMYALTAEEAGADIWAWEHSEGPGETHKGGPSMDGAVQVWDPDEIGPKAGSTDHRKQLRPPARFEPMKAPSRASNMFNELAAVKNNFATPEFFKIGVVIEPKWNGFRLVSEVWDDNILMFMEDEKRDLSKALPSMASELKAMPGPFVIDGECMAVEKDGKPVARRDLAGFRPEDDAQFRFRVANALHLPDGNIMDLPYLKQKQQLQAFLSRHYKGKRIELTPHRVAHSWAEMQSHIQWASKVPGSEGAMLKLADSTYSLSGENDGWAKYKKQRAVQARVYKRDAVKDSPGRFNLSCAVGPVDARHWQETVDIGGKAYTPIGSTRNAKTDANVGDVIVADVLELAYERVKTGKQKLQWYGPSTLLSPGTMQGNAFTADQVLDMLQPEEFKKHVDNLLEHTVQIVSKDEGSKDECYVFGEVLVPNIGTGEPKDSQNDTYNEDDVAEACYSFMRRGHKLGLMHKGFIGGKAVLLENYLMPIGATLKDMANKDRTIPKGTWMMKLQIIDAALKKAVRAGKLTGFSVGGTGTRTRVA